ncbi:hypothetical protein [Streptomyces sp. NBC_00827]|uniref:hypothetical protein n=1 Tax=Streptomyces sp. NBC_00827 TaxID=2903677 RepID=UPI00386D1AA0|nr:hypothetical protein OG569_15720 [Streptomyces sp. NBC_00827]
MGSMRNPVGPLPSTIYWRRRAVLLSLVAVLALLIVWVVGTGGGGGTNNGDGSNGKNPVSTITPGPSGSGPAISQNPGGRDESTAGTGDSGSGDGSDGGSGDGSGSGSTSGSGDSGTSSGTGSDDGSNGAGGSADQIPAGSTLPNCTASAVKLTLRSVRNTYAPGEKPTIEFTAKNSSGSDCKVDLGPKNTVLTITQAGSDDDIWSSDDCPTGSGSLLYRVAANGQVTHTLEWDRKASAPECATPPALSATAGTYLVEAQAPGLTKAQTSFVLSKD